MGLTSRERETFPAWTGWGTALWGCALRLVSVALLVGAAACGEEARCPLGSAPRDGRCRGVVSVPASVDTLVWPLADVEQGALQDSESSGDEPRSLLPGPSDAATPPWDISHVVPRPDAQGEAADSGVDESLDAEPQYDPAG